MFQTAKPIFLKGRSEEPNVQAGFRTKIQISDGHNYEISIAARTFYRLYINGSVVMHGPARTAAGYLRVDSFQITDFLQCGENIIAIEVISYGNNFNYSNDITCESGMLQAEICEGSRVIAATDSAWQAIRICQREQKSERISHCRQQAELYYIDEIFETWTTTADDKHFTGSIEILDESTTGYLERGMPLPAMEHIGGAQLVEYGSARLDDEMEVHVNWFENNIRDYLKDVLERPYVDYRRTKEISGDGKIDFLPVSNANQKCPVSIAAPDIAYLHYDFGNSYLGFIGIDVECGCDGILDIVHLETYCLIDGKHEIDGGTNPVTRLHVTKGRHSFLTREPALARYIKIYFRPEGRSKAPQASITINNLYVLTYCYKDTGMCSFQCSDDNINRLYNAAKRTLILNTLDIFMDCPERERGGWLCDSLWTARAAAMMLGDMSVERAFIENFLLVKNMWKGFVPEVYPAYKPNYSEFPGITTWTFWLMAELCEYAARSGDMEFIHKYHGRVAEFVNGSYTLLGESGLIENLPWLFIDWSLANESDYNQPISVPANSLYAYVLKGLGALYDEADWVRKGEAIAEILKSALLDGQKTLGYTQYIPDNLKYENGRFIALNKYSEAAHYTTLWTGLFTKEELGCVYHAVVRTMGPAPHFTKSPIVGNSGLFIGLCIRLDMLARFGEYDTLFNEMKAIYYPQLAEGPGTLWENQILDTSSRCHGFTGHVGVHLLRDILGIQMPDGIRKKIAFSDPHLNNLRWARGFVSCKIGGERVSACKMAFGEGYQQDAEFLR